MPHQTLSQALLRDLVTPAGLTPIFGEASRPSVLLEHMSRERRVAGEVLQNIEALTACMISNLNQHARGELTPGQLIAELAATLEVIEGELAYDEAELLVAG